MWDLVFRMLNKEFDTAPCLTNRIFSIPDSQSLILCTEWYAGVERINSTALTQSVWMWQSLLCHKSTSEKKFNLFFQTLDFIYTHLNYIVHLFIYLYQVYFRVNVSNIQRLFVRQSHFRDFKMLGDTNLSLCSPRFTEKIGFSHIRANYTSNARGSLSSLFSLAPFQHIR